MEPLEPPLNPPLYQDHHQYTHMVYDHHCPQHTHLHHVVSNIVLFLCP